MITLTGLPSSEYKGVQCQIEPEDLSTNIKVIAKSKKDGSRFEQTFTFQTDRFDLGAAFILGLARQEALFAWMGKSSSDNDYVLRTHWFTRSGRQAAVSYLTSLKENPEIEPNRLDSLIKLLSRPRLLVLRIDPLLEEDKSPGFIFPMSNISLANGLWLVRDNDSRIVRLIGGLKVVSNNGTISLAAGNSRLLELSDEQRRALSLILQRLLETDRVLAFRKGEISFFTPRDSTSVREKGVRISVLGRSVPITDIRDAARLAVIF